MVYYHQRNERVGNSRRLYPISLLFVIQLKSKLGRYLKINDLTIFILRFNPFIDG